MQFRDFWFIHNVVQPSPLFNFRTFSSSLPHSPKIPYPLAPILSQLLATVNLFSVSMDMPVLGMSHTWSHTSCCLLCLVPFLSIVCSGSVHRAACVSTSFLFVADTPVCGWTTSCYPFIHWWTFGLFPLSDCNKHF